MEFMSILTEKAQKLLKGVEKRLAHQRALVGLDGYVDQIIRVVDKQQNDGKSTYIDRMSEWGVRIQAASGKSTKFEFSVQQIKLGGNGPIMANALACFGLPTTCIGNLGFPDLHPVFHPMKKNCEVITIADACYTDAVEFNDGKVMLSRQESLAGINWDCLERVIGKESLFHLLDEARLIALTNWSAFPHMSEIWRKLQEQICPNLSQIVGEVRRNIFFDLSHPAFRLTQDIIEAMELISKFQQWFDVTLGLNQKEAEKVAEILKIPVAGRERDFVRNSAETICLKLGIHNVVVHAIAYAGAASLGKSVLVEGPFIEKPVISTGAGDHFNAGYSLGMVLGGDLEQRLQLGVVTSGFYVRTAQSPSIADLKKFLLEIG